MGTLEWYTVVFQPSEGSVRGAWPWPARLGPGMHKRPTILTLVYLDRYEGARSALAPWCTEVGGERDPGARLGLCLVCLVFYEHMGWGPPDLFQPKLTLLSSGLLGFPEWGLIRSNIPLWVPGTSYHFKQENPLVPESPYERTVSPRPGSRFHSERSVVRFVLFLPPFWEGHL